jgi:hypothetical protein
MGCAAEVIALDDVRAIQQRQALRQQLHERFDQWLDEVEARLPEAKPTLAQVSETIWSLRQGLTASVAQTMIEQAHQEEQNRKAWRCATCDRLVSARPAVSRTVRTLVGDFEIKRPYFYCRYCGVGTSPLDTVLGLSAGQIQLDVQQVAAGIHVRRDTLLSITYSEELIFPMSATLQSTDRHYGIVGQEYCHFQRDS